MKNDGSSKDDRYLLWTCGLMALIIVSLAVLWIQQRRRTQQVAQQLSELLAEHDKLKLSFAVAQMRWDGMLGGRPIGVDQPVTIDGQEMTALLVSPQTGRTLGLAPGEVLIVAEELSPEPPEGERANVLPPE